MPTYQSMRQGYSNLWRTMRVRPDKIAAADNIAKAILRNKQRYQRIETRCGVPWFMVAAIHSLEGALAFDRCLHNGERILGTGRKTSLVPKGRGPFADFEEAATDAPTMPPHALDQVREWPIARILYECERYNGFGYLGRVNSPYLWSFSNHYTAGKYVADHLYSAKAVSEQCGAAVIMSRLCVFDDDVRARIAIPRALPVPPPPDVEARTLSQAAGWRALFTFFASLFSRKG